MGHGMVLVHSEPAEQSNLSRLLYCLSEPQKTGIPCYLGCVWPATDVPGWCVGGVTSMTSISQLWSQDSCPRVARSPFASSLLSVRTLPLLTGWSGVHADGLHHWHHRHPQAS